MCGETQEAVRSRRRVDNTMSKIKRIKGVQTIIYKALHKSFSLGTTNPLKTYVSFGMVSRSPSTSGTMRITSWLLYPAMLLLISQLQFKSYSI